MLWRAARSLRPSQARCSLRRVLRSAPELDPRVLAEISRVLVPGGTVYVLGGSGALSPAVDTALEARGFKVKRVFGADEYATAVAIAHELGDPTTVFEATGHSFADALSAVPAAIKTHGAILLTNGNVQAPATAAYLAAHPSDTRYAIGGSMAAAGADPSATAVFGADLYGTSAAVATKFFPAATSFAVATGLKFPDALSGGVMEGASTRPDAPRAANRCSPCGDHQLLAVAVVHSDQRRHLRWQRSRERHGRGELIAVG